MTLRQIFKHFAPGDICTGTIHRFNLVARALLDAGVINEIEVKPVRENPDDDRSRIIVQGRMEYAFLRCPGRFD